MHQMQPVFGMFWLLRLQLTEYYGSAGEIYWSIHTVCGIGGIYMLRHVIFNCTCYFLILWLIHSGSLMPFLSVLWKQLISMRVSNARSVNFSALAKITDGFTPGHLLQAVDTVLNERRVHQLSSKPLEASEFLGPLSRYEPVYKDEEETFKVHIREYLWREFAAHNSWTDLRDALLKTNRQFTWE